MSHSDENRMVESAPSQQRLKSLEQRVLDFIQSRQLVSGKKLVVAVSGGADSVCLLHILVKLQEKLKVKLHIAHLNHQLRGAESEADAKYVSGSARKLGISATIEGREVKGYQAEHHLSLEEAAREVRYGFLAEVAKAIGAERVAVGHTRDDHIETILLHLIRGTGTRGLHGLQPYTEWESKAGSIIVIRPLLEISHQETEDYCQNHKLKPRLDASNTYFSPLRNRIRHQLLPLLKNYNPGIAEALLRTGRIASDDIAFLDKEVARVWDEVAQQQGKTIVLDKGKLNSLPPALKRYLLRAAVERMLGSAKDIEMRHIEEVISALDKPAGKRLSLPQGLIFSIEYDRYLLTSDPTALSPLPVLNGESQIKIPGETSLSGWLIEATVINREGMTEKGDFIAYLDLGKIGDKLLVRPRQRGDRFQPLGLSKAKKLNEFMIDAKIPSAWRQRVPIVCSPEQIVWVVGWRIDERAKVSEKTKKVLQLKFERG
jgi:tRNA(Ile)-lysidine synthase